MSWPTNVIAILRRRRSRVGRFCLAWFVLASASASAAPCLAMTLSAAPAADAVATAQHDTEAMPAAAGHEHSAAAHENAAAHAHSAAHDHSPTSEQPNQPQDPPGPCAHCPLSVAMTASSHAWCSAADDVADGGKTSAPPIVLKALLSAPVVVLVPIDFGPGFARGTQGPLNRAAPSLRLNLRHCVFLI